MSLAIDLSVAARWNQTTDDGEPTRQAVDQNTLSLIETIANGNGPNQADLILHGTETIEVVSPLTIDLAGTAEDIFGNVVAMDRVKLIMIIVREEDSGGGLTVGGTFRSYLGGTTPTVSLPNGGCVVLFNPTLSAWSVTAGSADTVVLTATGAACTVDYVIVGASA